MGGAAKEAMNEAREREAKREEEERIRYMAESEMARENPFGGYGDDEGYGHGYGGYEPTSAVPKRYQNPFVGTGNGNGNGFGGGSIPTTKKRDPAKEVQFDGGPIPALGSMTEAEYTEFVRTGMDRLKRKTESSYIAQQQAEKERKEHERLLAAEREEEAARKAEKKRQKKIQQKLADERRVKEQQDIWVFNDFKKNAREHYRARWIAITKVGGEIEETRIGYGDIPWPVYYPNKGIEKTAVRDFMVDMSKENGEDLKKGLREAIRAFHPDRFFGRILPRTNEGEREKVREGVESCIRVINDLLAETRK